MLAAAMPIVHFQYVTGLARCPLSAAFLSESGDGRTSRAMQEAAHGTRALPAHGFVVFGRVSI
jgi:hypothetical protein